MLKDQCRQELKIFVYVGVDICARCVYELCEIHYISFGLNSFLALALAFATSRCSLPQANDSEQCGQRIKCNLLKMCANSSREYIYSKTTLDAVCTLYTNWKFHFGYFDVFGFAECTFHLHVTGNSATMQCNEQFHHILGITSTLANKYLHWAKQYNPSSIRWLWRVNFNFIPMLFNKLWIETVAQFMCNVIHKRNCSVSRYITVACLADPFVIGTFSIP